MRKFYARHNHFGNVSHHTQGWRVFVFESKKKRDAFVVEYLNYNGVEYSCNRHTWPVSSADIKIYLHEKSWHKRIILPTDWDNTQVDEMKLGW